MSRSPTQVLRKSFSLAKSVKSLYPDTEAREQLCFDLSLHYEEALFSTEDDPYQVQWNDVVFLMYPTRKNDTKIRVRVKP